MRKCDADIWIRQSKRRFSGLNQKESGNIGINTIDSLTVFSFNSVAS